MARGSRTRRKNPTAGTCDLLGLKVPAALPKASRVRLSRHAVERYMERCRPELDYDAAFAELRYRVGGSRVVRHRPEWVGVPKGFVVEDAVGYVLVGGVPPLALPVQWTDGRPVAVTCLAGA